VAGDAEEKTLRVLASLQELLHLGNGKAIFTQVDTAGTFSQGYIYAIIHENSRHGKSN
jgi:hypothetical protein